MFGRILLLLVGSLGGLRFFGRMGRWVGFEVGVEWTGVGEGVGIAIISFSGAILAIWVRLWEESMEGQAIS